MRQRHDPITTPGRPLRAGAALVLVLLLAALAGCGGSSGGGEDSASRPASPASDFPAPKGMSLEQFLSENASAQGPVVSPSARVLSEGENRFAFGVFTTGRDTIDDADVAIYAAPGPNLKGPAIGPFPARIEDLATEASFRASTTANDPDAAKVIYVAELPLDEPGAWSFAALTKDGDSFQGSLIATPSLVGQYDNVPQVGDKAPVVSTPTADDVSDLSQIDTRIPPSSMHDQDLADVLGKEPVVLLFATPQLCQSRICGPVVDVAEQVKQQYGDEVAFIDMEIYNDNEVSKGERPQVRAYGLPSEPWLFVIDKNGKVSTVVEGAFSVDELEAAVKNVAD
ncbi:MAG: hypothetical protein EXQ70_06975 [Solirubrobacterales bacterium]|nr:hypothetical protein [Solirubrobacterales bacterium]